MKPKLLTGTIPDDNEISAFDLGTIIIHSVVRIKLYSPAHIRRIDSYALKRSSGTDAVVGSKVTNAEMVNLSRIQFDQKTYLHLISL